MSIDLNILYEDEDIVVCEKPINVLSQSGKGYADDMVNLLKNYLYEKYGIVNGYIGLVHRLDRGVGGVMVFAKSPKALSSLNKQIQDKKFVKSYFAVCENINKKEIKVGDTRNVVDFLVKDAKNNISTITKEKSKNAKRSELNLKVLEIDTKTSLILVDVTLLTGRHHQIRVQMNGQGFPLWGDTKYNKDFLSRHNDMKWCDVALYSYKLSFEHPINKKKMEFVNKPVNKPFCDFEYLNI